MHVLQRFLYFFLNCEFAQLEMICALWRGLVVRIWLKSSINVFAHLQFILIYCLKNLHFFTIA